MNLVLPTLLEDDEAQRNGHLGWTNQQLVCLDFWLSFLHPRAEQAPRLLPLFSASGKPHNARNSPLPVHFVLSVIFPAVQQLKDHPLLLLHSLLPLHLSLSFYRSPSALAAIFSHLKKNKKIDSLAQIPLSYRSWEGTTFFVSQVLSMPHLAPVGRKISVDEGGVVVFRIPPSGFCAD
ncbi:hypothetical protein LZ32DRAFT_284821 [Colletotrichum eremochloae]|nr:hypothetical protein LZ32DRAFT_284821 [Colletotrichum eremochloae]